MLYYCCHGFCRPFLSFGGTKGVPRMEVGTSGDPLCPAELRSSKIRVVLGRNHRIVPQHSQRELGARARGTSTRARRCAHAAALDRGLLRLCRRITDRAVSPQTIELAKFKVRGSNPRTVASLKIKMPFEGWNLPGAEPVFQIEPLRAVHRQQMVSHLQPIHEPRIWISESCSQAYSYSLAVDFP